MNTKKLNIKTLVRLQKQFAAIYYVAPLCGISATGVHILGLNNLRDLAPTGCELITEPRDEAEYPYETHFMYADVRFYAIHAATADLQANNAAPANSDEFIRRLAKAKEG